MNDNTDKRELTLAPVDSLAKLTYKGRPVLTTEMLAQCYGTDENNLHQNYGRNKDRFVEGVHFIRLSGADLKAFKNHMTNSQAVSARSSSLMLWTERGAARHAKLLETDQAWEVFEKLEDSYFGQPITKSAPAQIREATSVFRACRSIGKLIGLDANQSALAANRAAINTTGVDVLATMGSTHLVAPQQEALLTPTDIGVRLGGMSGRAVNQLLEDRGFQIEYRDAKRKAYWSPTLAGAPFAVFLDTNKKHADGTPVRQLKWTANIVRELGEAA